MVRSNLYIYFIILDNYSFQPQKLIYTLHPLTEGGVTALLINKCIEVLKITFSLLPTFVSMDSHKYDIVWYIIIFRILFPMSVLNI